MVNDVSLVRLDAPTVHTREVARAFVREGFEVDLVARGPDPELPGVRFHGGPPFRWNDPRRIYVVNGRAARVLWQRRGRVRSLYVREDWASVMSHKPNKTLTPREILLNRVRGASAAR